MEALFVVGLDAWSGPVEIRERLATSSDDIGPGLADLIEKCHLSEAMILSTCNRVEIWGAAGEDQAPIGAWDHFCRRRAVDPATVLSAMQIRRGAAAVRHAFRVAASLDSVVLGESQILGQVKQAFACAQQCATVGPLLDRLVTRAFAVAKRVRNETELGHHAVSVSSVAVELARKIFGDLETRSVLLIGAGEMAELSARNLIDQGVTRLYVSNRTWVKATALAEHLGATAVPFEERDRAISLADIVITSTGAPEPIITRPLVRTALAERGSRPLFLIDIAVPRDVEAAVGEIANVFRYDIDDLRGVVRWWSSNRLYTAHEEVRMQAEKNVLVLRLANNLSPERRRMRLVALVLILAIIGAFGSADARVAVPAAVVAGISPVADGVTNSDEKSRRPGSRVPRTGPSDDGRAGAIGLLLLLAISEPAPSGASFGVS